MNNNNQNKRLDWKIEPKARLVVQKENWEIEFKKLVDWYSEDSKKAIKQFIRNLLQSERQKLIEKIEGMKEEYKTRKRMTPFQDTLFNHAVNVLSDLLAILKETK